MKDELTLPEGYYTCTVDEPQEPVKDNHFGYLHNCHLVPKGDDKMFYLADDGSLRPTLDGYAIIPMEVYEQLKKDAKK